MKQRMRLVVNVTKIQFQEFATYIQWNRSQLVIASLANRRRR